MSEDLTNKPEGKRCPFRVIKTRRGLLTRTETTSFKKCLGDRCPYFNKYSIFCEKAREGRFMRNNKGLTLVELLITVLMFGILALVAYALIVYGNKPVSEMPIWLYWLIGRS